MAEDTSLNPLAGAPVADPQPDAAVDPGAGSDAAPDLSADPDEESEGALGSEETPAAAGESAVIDGKRLSAGAKAALAEIKAKDPKLALEIKQALFQSDALRRAAPGGVREIAELRQTVEDLGGAEGIQAIRQEQHEWAALDQQFESGDPAFVENIAAESPEAFLKLAPAAFQKFQELNPEGYSAYISQVFVADMQQEGIPLALERLQDFIGDNPKAMAIWKQLAGYVNRVAGFAAKPVETPRPNARRDDSGIDERERGLAEREASLIRTDWRGAADSQRMSLFNAEYTRLAAGRKLNDAQTAAVKELYLSRLAAALRKTPKFNETIDRYFERRDREGYLRFIGSIYKQEIPRALRSAFDSVVPAKPGPKVNPAAPGANGKAAAAAAGAPAAGFAWTAAVPGKDKIDFRKTSADMIREGKAVLTDGKRVQWKR